MLTYLLGFLFNLLISYFLVVAIGITLYIIDFSVDRINILTTHVTDRNISTTPVHLHYPSHPYSAKLSGELHLIHYQSQNTLLKY